MQRSFAYVQEGFAYVQKGFVGELWGFAYVQSAFATGKRRLEIHLDLAFARLWNAVDRGVPRERETLSTQELRDGANLHVTKQAKNALIEAAFRKNC